MYYYTECLQFFGVVIKLRHAKFNDNIIYYIIIVAITSRAMIHLSSVLHACIYTCIIIIIISIALHTIHNLIIITVLIAAAACMCTSCNTTSTVNVELVTHIES